jgi:hypothetical protein
MIKPPFLDIQDETAGFDPSVSSPYHGLLPTSASVHPAVASIPIVQSPQVIRSRLHSQLIVQSGNFTTQLGRPFGIGIGCGDQGVVLAPFFGKILPE